MIIARLSGGLGNQFFQYAAAKSLAVHTNSNVGLDISFFEESPNRIFELDKFNVDARVLDSNEIKNVFSIKQNFFKSLFETKINSLNLLQNHTYFEKYFHFDDNFFQIKSPIILDGYWQSELFFKKYVNDVLSDLTFIVEPVIQEDVSQILKSFETVSLHIRRGDYAWNPEINKIHGICADDYYFNAITMLKKDNPELRTLVFSDDMVEGNRIAALIENAFVIDKKEDTYHDFFVMQKCNHNIIANSSFSWWAAYLNKNKGKKVVAPLHWFADDFNNIKDLLPSSWIQI
jgi:hypothetical protein